MRKIIFFILFFLPLISHASTYGSNVLVSGIASASSDNGSDVSSRAFDANVATWWQSNSGALPQWLKYDLGTSSSAIFNKITLTIWKDVDGGAVKDFQVLGSNDDVSYSVITTSTASNSADQTALNFFFDENQVAYRYLKFQIDTNWRVDNVVIVRELSAYECTDCIGSALDVSDSFWAMSQFLLDILIVCASAWFIKKLLI